MPRGRFISREISLDEKVDALSNDTARLLFTWLIPHLDCEGRMHGDATTVKSIVFPRRSMHTRTVEKYLKQMEKLGLILRYSVNETQISSKENAHLGAQNTYLLAPNFEKHQMGLQKSKEAQSHIPPPPPDLLQTYSRVSPPQVKVKVKVEDKDSSSSESENSQVNNISEDMAEIAILYEAEIGKITSFVAQELNDAIQNYPADQIKGAIKEAVKQNKRKWSYVKGILKNWQEHPSKKDDPDKYIKGKYGHMVKR